MQSLDLSLSPASFRLQFSLLACALYCTIEPTGRPLPDGTTADRSTPGLAVITPQDIKARPALDLGPSCPCAQVTWGKQAVPPCILTSLTTRATIQKFVASSIRKSHSVLCLSAVPSSRVWLSKSTKLRTGAFRTTCRGHAPRQLSSALWLLCSRLRSTWLCLLHWRFYWC